MAEDPGENDISTPAGPRRRRKFTEDMDLNLLREVINANAHLKKHGMQSKAFDTVAECLNAAKVLPWPTDGKHCYDRYRLLVSSTKHVDRGTVHVNGTEHLSHTPHHHAFGERERLLLDIRSRALGNEDGLDSAEEGDGSTARKRKREGSGRVSETLLKLDDRHAEQENLRLRLEAARLDLERDRVELDKARFALEKEMHIAKLEEIRLQTQQQKQLIEEQRLHAEQMRNSTRMQVQMLELLSKFAPNQT